MPASILRPAFTRVLIQQLEKGACIRLHGPEAQGRARLLDDLEALADHDLGMVRVDMAVFAKDFSALMHGLAAAIGSDEAPEDLSEWVEALKLQGGQWALVLDHYDALEAPDRDPRYDEGFFTTLQVFAFSPRLGLLVVADRPARAHIADMEAFAKSFDLDLEEMPLPPLSLRRLQEEFSRLAPDQPEGAAFATAAFSHPLPLEFLSFLAGKVNAAAPVARAGLHKSIPGWRNEFDRARGIDLPFEAGGQSGWRKVLSWFRRGNH